MKHLQLCRGKQLREFLRGHDLLDLTPAYNPPWSFPYRESEVRPDRTFRAVEPDSHFIFLAESDHARIRECHLASAERGQPIYLPEPRIEERAVQGSSYVFEEKRGLTATLIWSEEIEPRPDIDIHALCSPLSAGTFR